MLESHIPQGGGLDAAARESPQFERRLRRRNPILGGASRGAVEAPFERETVVRRSLTPVAMMLVLGLPSVALAQATEAARVNWIGPFAVIAAGLGMAVAAGLCGLGQGKAIAAAVDAMGRQPGAAARIQTAMIIGLALIESLAIYTLVVAMILLFVQPIK